MSEDTAQHPLYSRLLGMYDLARNYAMSLARNSHDADEVVQETYLKLWRVRDSLRDANPKSCLTTAVRNTYIDMYRRRKKRSHMAATDEIIRNIPEELPYELPFELSDALERGFNSLPESRQEILKDLSDKLSRKELSAKHNIPIGTVVSRLHTAKQKVREYLEKKVPEFVPAAANVA